MFDTDLVSQVRAPIRQGPVRHILRLGEEFGPLRGNNGTRSLDGTERVHFA